VLGQIARLRSEPMDAARIADRATFVANGLSSQTERAAGLANYLSTLVASDASLDVLASEVSAKAPPSPEDIAATVAGHIRSDRATLILAGDSKQWIAALRERYPAVKLIDVDGKPLP
jgi:zinc protease